MMCAAWAARLAHGHEPADCARVPAWERDGVRFEILHPAPVRAPSKEPAGAGALMALAMNLAPNPFTLADLVNWTLGSVANRSLSDIGFALPFLIPGMALLWLARGGLSALALGEDAGRALGAHVGRVRLASLLLIAVLCGAATAAAGPIVFLGLTVPHVARILVGTDHRWVLPVSALLSPVLLLGADVLGRVLERPGEIEVGIMTDLGYTLYQGPFFAVFLLVRLRRRKPDRPGPK